MNTLNPHAFPLAHDPLVEKLRRFRSELAELAFTLDSRGHAEAADTTTSIVQRLGELLENEPPALSLAP